MGCGESKTKKQRGSFEAGGAAGGGSGQSTTDPGSPAVQIANARPSKSAMKKRVEPNASSITPPNSARGVGHAFAAHDGGEEELSDRSFVKEDLTGSFRRTGAVSEKGDCRVVKGVMAPSTSKFPSDKASSRAPSEAAPLSSHSSDSDLALVCIDCGREIDEKAVGQLCPVTAKLHG